MEQDENVERLLDQRGRVRVERPKNGTGVVRTFNENGVIHSEGWMQNGINIGYIKMFDTDGTVSMVKFWNNLKYISKKKYHALCDKDPTLPRFDNINEYCFLDEDLKRERRRQRKQAKLIQQQDNTEDRRKYEEFCQKLLDKGRTEEAISWLSEKSKGTITLGELQTNHESLELVRKLYRLGAEKVMAVEISKDDLGEYTGKLVVLLPEDAAKRKKLFRWFSANARSMGFDPDVDIGQKHLFAMLD